MIFTAKSAEFLRWAEEKEKNIPQNSDGILVNIHDINNVKTSEIAKIKETIYKYTVSYTHLTLPTKRIV